MTTGLPEQQPPARNAPPSFRVDIPLHDLLKQPKATRPPVPPPRSVPLQKLPEPLGYCYDDRRVIKWILKQAARAFQGVSGSFED
jgi:hypothetical protein